MTSSPLEGPPEDLSKQAFASRLAKFSELKRTSFCLAKLGEQAGYDSGQQPGCATHLVFREPTSGEHAGERRLHAARFCRSHLTCPLCASRRAVQHIRGYVPKVMQLLLTVPGLELHMFTFTQRTGLDLAERFQALDGQLKSWRDLVRQQRHRLRGPLSCIRGGLMAIETKLNRDAWHEHCHALIITEGKPDYTRIQPTWDGRLMCMPCDAELLRIEGHVKAGTEEHRRLLGFDLAEVIKYPIKFGDVPAGPMWHASKVLHGRHTLRPFGCLVGVDVPDSLLDEPLNWDELAYIDHWYRFAAGGYQETTPPRIKEDDHGNYNLPDLSHTSY